MAPENSSLTAFWYPDSCRLGCPRTVRHDRENPLSMQKTRRRFRRYLKTIWPDVFGPVFLGPNPTQGTSADHQFGANRGQLAPRVRSMKKISREHKLSWKSSREHRLVRGPQSGGNRRGTTCTTGPEREKKTKRSLPCSVFRNIYCITFCSTSCNIYCGRSCIISCVMYISSAVLLVQ